MKELHDRFDSAIGAWLLLTIASVWCAYALASVVTTDTPGLWELRDAASHPLGPKFPTYPECKAEASRAVGEYRCVNVTPISVVGVCDTPMPVVAEAGLVVQALPDGSWGPTMRQGYVQAAYPACWATGLVPYTGEVSAPDGPLDTSPGPWIEGLDYPLGTPCPAAAHGVCYAARATTPHLL